MKWTIGMAMVRQSMVRNSARNTLFWLMATMPEISLEARPVAVMQPAMQPATAQATATVMVPFPPASSEAMMVLTVRLTDSPMTFPAPWA